MLSADRWNLIQAAASDSEESDATGDPSPHVRAFLREHVDPVVRQVIWQRLHRRLNPGRKGESDPDAEDLYQKVLLNLTHVLNGDEGLPAGRIKKFRNFVAAVAHRVCTDEIRERSPIWSSKMASTRELFNRHPDLASWRVGPLAPGGKSRVLCGFVRWEGEGETKRTLAAVEKLEAEPGSFREARFPHTDLSQIKLILLIAEVLDWVRGPVEMKRLVDLIVLLQRVPELVTESLDDPEEGHNYLLRFTSDPDSNIAATELLAAVWSESNRLPLQHRRTLFFTFDDGAGESLLHLLRRSGVITIDDAVKSLEMGHRELEGIWDGLPLSITEAAAVLETTKGNIKKWRHRATTKLADALGITDARKPKAR